MVFFDSHLIRINGLGKLWLFYITLIISDPVPYIDVWVSRDVPLLIKWSNRRMADIYREEGGGQFMVIAFLVSVLGIYTAFLKSLFNTAILTPSLNSLKISIYQDLYFCYTSLIFRRLSNNYFVYKFFVNFFNTHVPAGSFSKSGYTAKF